MALFKLPNITEPRTADTDWETDMYNAEQSLNAAGRAKARGDHAAAAGLENSTRAYLDHARSARKS